MTEDTRTTRTASETVMQALEDFGTSEPQYLIVVWVDESGDIAMARSNRTSTTWQLGLLESAKMMIAAYLGSPNKDSE